MAKTKRPPQTRKKLGGPRVSPDGPRQAKVEAVEDFKARLGGSNAAILTEYRGLTVKELAELRAGLREAGGDFKVFKNTLAAIAVKDLGLDELIPLLEGPTAVTFVADDPVVTAKRLAEFAKKAPSLIFKGGILDGQVLSGGQVTALSALDSREVMLAKVAGLFASPLQKLAYLFAAPLQQLGGLFAQLKDKLPAEAASAPAPAATASADEAGETAEPSATAPEGGDDGSSAPEAEQAPEPTEDTAPDEA